MDFNFYQERAKSFAVGAQDPRDTLTVYMLGLVGEAGEVIEKYKKMIRDGKNDEQLRIDMKKELGDVLWYIAILGDHFAYTLEEIASANIVKLQSRKDRNAIHGAGDNR